MQYLIEQEIRKIDQYKIKLLIVTAIEVCLDLIPACTTAIDINPYNMPFNLIFYT